MPRVDGVPAARGTHPDGHLHDRAAVVVHDQDRLHGVREELGRILRGEELDDPTREAPVSRGDVGEVLARANADDALEQAHRAPAHVPRHVLRSARGEPAPDGEVRAGVERGEELGDTLRIVLTIGIDHHRALVYRASRRIEARYGPPRRLRD